MIEVWIYFLSLLVKLFHWQMITNSQNLRIMHTQIWIIKQIFSEFSDSSVAHIDWVTEFDIVLNKHRPLSIVE